jgi:hypothetical protein
MFQVSHRSFYWQIMSKANVFVQVANSNSLLLCQDEAMMSLSTLNSDIYLIQLIVRSSQFYARAGSSLRKPLFTKAVNKSRIGDVNLY